MFTLKKHPIYSYFLCRYICLVNHNLFGWNSMDNLQNLSKSRCWYLQKKYFFSRICQDYKDLRGSTCKIDLHHFHRLIFFFLAFQYFVFDFHMPGVMLFDKIITLTVSWVLLEILLINSLLTRYKLFVDYKKACSTL